MYMKHVKDMLLDKPTSYELSKKKKKKKEWKIRIKQKRKNNNK